MRKVLTIAVAAVCAFALAGCSGSGETDRVESQQGSAFTPSTNVFVQTMPDGREVTCIFAKRGTGSGLSCDWDNAG